MTDMAQPPERDDDDAMIMRMLDELARAPAPDAPDDLLARVLADGDALLPASDLMQAPARTVSPAPWWRQIVDALGGWSAASGVVAAAATGFVIGLGGIDAVDIDAMWSRVDVSYYEVQDPFGAFGWDLEEG